MQKMAFTPQTCCRKLDFIDYLARVDAPRRTPLQYDISGLLIYFLYLGIHNLSVWGYIGCGGDDHPDIRRTAAGDPAHGQVKEDTRR